MKSLDSFEVWFLTGSQGLYGEDVLRQVAENSAAIAGGLDGADDIPVRIVPKPVVSSPEAIEGVCREANTNDRCVGVIAWMHTFSPAKMWIPGLMALDKPLLHLHTQFNRDLPWAEIDMDFMNLNQAAHGDREFGFVLSRLRVARKIVVGHWQDPAVAARIGSWARAACGRHESRNLKLARFGSNMRRVAVTDGDRLEAQVRLGVAVDGFGVADLETAMANVERQAIHKLIGEYHDEYEMAPELARGGDRHESLVEAARIEAGLRDFLEAGGFMAFTDTFEDLAGLPQLPGHRRAAVDGRRLRVRSRGGLEDGDDGPDHEGDGCGPQRWRVLHGGLHLPLRRRWAQGPRRPHARGVPFHRRGPAVV